MGENETLNSESEIVVINYEDYKETEGGKKKESKWALKGRLRSTVLWSAIVGLVIIVFSALGLWEKIGIESGMFKDFMTAIGSVLTAFGVLNDPTNPEGF